MAITTGAHPKSLWPGVKKFFGKTYAEKQIIAEMVFPETSSEKAYEEYVEETGFGLAAAKSEGASVQYDTDAQGYVSRIRNTTYALGAKVTMEAIQDNQYEDVASRKAAKLARSYRATKETVFANIMNRAFNASYTGGDGVELLSTAHPTLSGNQSNELAVAADLSEASLEDLLTQIRGARDSRGIRAQLVGQKLVVPASLEFEAARIMKSTLQSGTGNNDINALRAGGKLPGGIVVWDYLTDEDAWFVTTDAEAGLIRQERMAQELTQDNDFDTANACMKVVGRYAGGWGDWRGIFGSAGA